MSDEEEIDFEAIAAEAFTEEGMQRLTEAAERSILLPAEFWDASPILGKVRRAAMSRLRSPDAVLAALLTRYSAIIPPSIVLPPIAGGKGSLNMIVGIVSRAGGRKSSTVEVARDLLPVDERKDVVMDLPLGSGEGIAEAYFGMVEDTTAAGKNKKMRKVRVKDSVHIYVDEGATIVSLGQRNASTTSSTLRTAWSGGTLGQTNASEEAKRVVTAHTYRLGLVAAFQFSNAANVLHEVEVGTPQRFLWAMTEHPDIGREECDWPGQLIVPNLSVIRNRFTEVDFAQSIVDEIRHHEILEASGRVTPEALDTHRRMMKMKIASLMALMMTGQLDVGTEHWELAEVWMLRSDRVRDLIMAVHQANLRDEAAARIDRRVKETVASHRAVKDLEKQEVASRTEACARKLTAKVYGGDIETIAEGRRTMRKYRDVFDDALDLALAEGWLIVVEKAGQGEPKKVLKRGPATPS